MKNLFNTPAVVLAVGQSSNKHMPVILTAIFGGVKDNNLRIVIISITEQKELHNFGITAPYSKINTVVFYC
jgi:hypothetical protein